MTRLTMQEMLDRAHSRLVRLTPTELAAALAYDGDVVVLDSRTPTDRDRFGCIVGAVHAPRSLLEFMCEPDWGYQHEAIRGFDQRLVVVCNGGFSSGLAAVSLQELGFHRATDLVGGMHAWLAAGLPVVPPVYQRLD